MPLFQKNSIPFSSLSWRPWPLKPLSSFPSRPVYGFDTETLDGYCRLITCSDGRVYEGDEIDEILAFLTFRDYRGAHNFFYNIDYDMDAIFKYLPLDTVKDFLLNGVTTYNGYRLKGIPGKVYSISKDKHRYSYYDLWQFYTSSLEVAAKKYLGKDKYVIPLDRHQIGTNALYWQSEHDNIVTYCLNDSRLTMSLGKALQKEVSKTFQFTPKHYISKAGLSKQYFRHKCHIPNVKKVPRPALEYAFNAYHGGRFEVTERGNVGYCTAIDINSAYPFQIANLLDITRGEWRHCRRKTKTATYGFYACRIAHPYSHLPLPALKMFGQTFYPYGDWYTYLTKDEIDALPPSVDVTIYAGWEFFPDELVYPFKDAIDHLYTQKSKAEKGSYQYSLYKIVMNSLYGAFYEKAIMPDGKIRVGSLFNPVYATLITARTRTALTTEAWKFRHKAVCLATDGLLIKGDIDYQESPDLGAFSVKERGDCVVLRSGIYTIGSDLKQRGVMKSGMLKTPYGEFTSIFEYLKAHPELSQYPVYLHRPIHLREAVKHCKKYTLEHVNRFLDLNMTFDLNTEIKRVFERRNLTGRDLLDSHITSIPWDAATLLKVSSRGERGRGK